MIDENKIPCKGCIFVYEERSHNFINCNNGASYKCMNPLHYNGNRLLPYGESYPMCNMFMDIDRLNYCYEKILKS